MTRKRLWQIAKAAWAVAVALIAIGYVLRSWEQLNTALALLPMGAIALGALLLVAGKLLLALNMQVALKRVGVSWSWGRCFKAYNPTQLGKYLPGSIWHFVGRAGVYTSAGISSPASAASMVLESVWIFLGAGTTGLLILGGGALFGHARGLEVLQTENTWIALAVAALLVLVAPIAVRLLLRRLPRSDLPTRPRLVDPRVVGLQGAIWLALGAAFAVTVAPLTAEPWLWIYATGLYGVAYAVGFAVPFAPAGLGVRDGILVAGLAGPLGADAAVLLSLVNRMLFLGVELLLAAGPVVWLWRGHTDTPDTVRTPVDDGARSRQESHTRSSTSPGDGRSPGG